MPNFQLNKSQVLDNVQFFKQNSEEDYSRCIQEMISKDPFRGHKFYIYSFVKRVDDISGIKKMFHQARLTKPEPIPGTTLLRVDPRDPGTATIIWTLPNQENFNMYKEGKMFADSFVHECVEKFLKNPMELMKKEDGDLSEEEIREIYKSKRGSKKIGPTFKKI